MLQSYGILMTALLPDTTPRYAYLVPPDFTGGYERLRPSRSKSYVNGHMYEA
jgi:hypothetical protein